MAKMYTYCSECPHKHMNCELLCTHKGTKKP